MSQMTAGQWNNIYVIISELEHLANTINRVWPNTVGMEINEKCLGLRANADFIRRAEGAGVAKP